MLQILPGTQSGAPYLQVAAELGQEGDGGARLQVRVQVLLKLRGHHSGEVGEEAGGDVDLTQHVHLGGGEGTLTVTQQAGGTQATDPPHVEE